MNYLAAFESNTLQRLSSLEEHVRKLEDKEPITIAKQATGPGVTYDASSMESMARTICDLNKKLNEANHRAETLQNQVYWWCKYYKKQGM